MHGETIKKIVRYRISCTYLVNTNIHGRSCRNDMCQSTLSSVVPHREQNLIY